MRYEFKPSFDRSIKLLPLRDKNAVIQTALQLVDILAQKKNSSVGIGLKRLRGLFWEARHGIKTRIIFRWDGDSVEFIMAGSHNQIRNYLRNIP